MVSQLLKGIREGFEIGYDGPEISRESPNLKSAREHPEVVSGYLAKECQLGRVGGPFEEPPFPNMQCHPIGVVPKKEAGKFRTILHLSYPLVSQLMTTSQRINIPCNTLPLTKLS